VLDRPDPVGGVQVQGNVRSQAVSPDSVPVGFCGRDAPRDDLPASWCEWRMTCAASAPTSSLVPAAGWIRGTLFDGTGLPWVKPSPNMPDLESALHYPGICLFEGTNVSVGRGTASHSR